MKWTVGIDIGGTFTDCACLCAEGVFWGKAPSTYPNPTPGVLSALEAAARRAGTTSTDILTATGTFVHGCTIGTNAVIQRTGARVALLVTAGHTDVLRIGRVHQKVAGLSFGTISHTSKLSRPRPLVEHSLTFGITERVDRMGEEVVQLDECQLRSLARQLRETDVRAVAICFLWSFVNPEHERAARRIVLEEIPEAEITLSSDISPLIGEYERAVTAVLNSYVSPSLRAYLSPLEDRLKAAGLASRLQVFHSAGGVTSVRGALSAGVRTLDSGPVGGVVGAQALGRRRRIRNLICADMGGTSFDVSVVWDGNIETDNQPVIDQYAYNIPRVSVRSIGSGGGSIAWVDETGSLRVGPESAGSIPGPACYGHGGSAPTVTDANLILGILSEEGMLPGGMRLQRSRAISSFARIGDLLGENDLGAIASAVIAVVNSQMADLVRRTTLEKGFDPQEFSLVVFGGAGGAHGAFIGRDIGAKTIIFPDMASVFAASGMASCDTLYSAETFVDLRSPFSGDALRRVSKIVGELAASVKSEFESDGTSLESIEYSAQAWMRYKGQAFGLPVEIDLAKLADPVCAQSLGSDPLASGFVELYRRTYGPAAPVDGVSIDIVRIRVEGRKYKDLASAYCASSTVTEILPISDHREVLLPGDPAFRQVDIVRLAGSLRPYAGSVLTGPLIVERYGDTVVIPAASTAHVDADGSIRIELTES